MQRLYWKVMKAFSALPTEERVRKMLSRDFLWCGLQMMIDEEEELARLCPSCRGMAREARCTACGALHSQVDVNENFDLDLFYQRGRGEC